MIFCVDDDNAIRDIEVYTLNSTGFNAVGFENGALLLDALENGDVLPDLIILDIMMPELDGVETLKRLREMEKTKDIPVIMATAKGAEYDKIQSLELGADDYLVKPFGVMEMVARVKAVLRRCCKAGQLSQSPSENCVTKGSSLESILAGKAAPELLIYGDISMNLTSHSVIVLGKKRDLTFKEFQLLKLFLENPGRVFTRDQILNAVWGTDFFGETRTVDMHVKTLRQKLDSCGGLIQTVINVGYGINVK